ncbi:MAG: DUF2170 family protein [Candidatus Margulisiibacteriota bacterium]|nr:DUF2170 family protein [Candidatus Margulisiibacteriota bacterium]
MITTKIANELADKAKSQDNGVKFDINPIPGDVEVLQIIIEDKEELPIFVSSTENHILCISYLFKQEEIKPEGLNELNATMLSANISMPLSSFALINGQYVLYGSLSANSSLDDIIYEIELLSNNTSDAVEALSQYLI